MAGKDETRTRTSNAKKPAGLSISRVFTRPGEDAFDAIEWSTRTSRITNPDGSVVFEMKDANARLGHHDMSCGFWPAGGGSLSTAQNMPRSRMASKNCSKPTGLTTKALTPRL